jgi:hypothetical protein
MSLDAGLYCDEDMSTFLFSLEGVRAGEAHYDDTADMLLVEGGFEGGDGAPCAENGEVEEMATHTVDKYEVLRNMYQLSLCVQMQRAPLTHGVSVVRMCCVNKMRQMMHFLQMGGESSVHESTVIQGILLLDWIIANEFTYFMRMKPEVLSGVCLILNADVADEREMGALLRLVAFASYGSAKIMYMDHVGNEVAKIDEQVQRRHEKIVFHDFVSQYFSNDVETTCRLEHFFFLYMTQKSGTWSLNIYETFVEIALKESTNMQAHVEILDDYLYICGERPAHKGPPCGARAPT